MNVLGISGSPNKDGSTAYAVRYALDVLEKDGMETLYLSLAGREIRPCIGCWKCTETGECIFDDDMNEIVDGMKWCDALILGSPIMRPDPSASSVPTSGESSRTDELTSSIQWLTAPTRGFPSSSDSV